MVTSDLNLLWSSSYLVVELRLDVGDGLTIVEFVTSLFEVVLHHINITIIVLFVNSWVSDHTDTEKMEALSYSLALQ